MLYLHENYMKISISHGNLNFENILLDEGFNVFIDDFYVTKIFKDDKTRLELIDNSLSFLAPEILNEDKI